MSVTTAGSSSSSLPSLHGVESVSSWSAAHTSARFTRTGSDANWSRFARGSTAVMSIVTVCPTAMSPMIQTPVAGSNVPSPVPDWNTSPAGTGSFTVTPVAASGPLLRTVNRYVNGVSTCTGAAASAVSAGSNPFPASTCLSSSRSICGGWHSSGSVTLRDASSVAVWGPVPSSVTAVTVFVTAVIVGQMSRIVWRHISTGVPSQTIWARGAFPPAQAAVSPAVPSTVTDKAVVVPL